MIGTSVVICRVLLLHLLLQDGFELHKLGTNELGTNVLSSACGVVMLALRLQCTIYFNNAEFAQQDHRKSS
jgi:hypothetical protein